MLLVVHLVREVDATSPPLDECMLRLVEHTFFAYNGREDDTEDPKYVYPLLNGGPVGFWLDSR